MEPNQSFDFQKTLAPPLEKSLGPSFCPSFSRKNLLVIFPIWKWNPTSLSPSFSLKNTLSAFSIRKRNPTKVFPQKKTAAHCSILISPLEIPSFWPPFTGWCAKPKRNDQFFWSFCISIFRRRKWPQRRRRRRHRFGARVAPSIGGVETKERRPKTSGIPSFTWGQTRLSTLFFRNEPLGDSRTAKVNI